MRDFIKIFFCHKENIKASTCFSCLNFQIKLLKMFFKLPFLTIIFTGVVIFENKIPLSFAKDVSTESTKVDQVEVASTLKIINQVNEAGRVQGQIDKKRRKSGGKTLALNPNKRKASSRSFGAPPPSFDNSKIISGIHFYSLI